MPATRQLVGVETLAEIVSAFNRHDLARTTVPSPTEVSRRAGHLRVLPGGSYFDV